jgi:hypothetical protein
VATFDASEPNTPHLLVKSGWQKLGEKKTMATHQEVVQRFESNQINRRTGDCSWQGSSVFCQGDALYSYGLHFVLAFRLAPNLFLKNGDRYSVSTSQHQAIVQRTLSGPTISFDALEPMLPKRFLGIASSGIAELGESNVLDYIEDSTVPCQRDKETGEWSNGFQPPNQGMFVETGSNDETAWGYWHTLGGALIRTNGSRFLCSLDEGIYFVSELSGKPDTVAEAFEDLKPAAVKEAESAGVKVQRQGEWFAIPSSRMRDGYWRYRLGCTQAHLTKTVAPIAPLPKQDSSSNEHWVRHLELNGELWGRGRMIHRNSWTGEPTREHRSLLLGDTWHRLVKNTELQSRSIGGRFD